MAREELTGTSTSLYQPEKFYTADRNTVQPFAMRTYAAGF